MGILDNNTLARYANYNFDGMVIKTKTYEKLGKFRISTDNQKPKEVVEKIVMALS
mgnify:CR=1 FL=1